MMSRELLLEVLMEDWKLVADGTVIKTGDDEEVDLWTNGSDNLDIVRARARFMIESRSMHNFIVKIMSEPNISYVLGKHMKEEKIAMSALIKRISDII